jgi:hypothetical protein
MRGVSSGETLVSSLSATRIEPRVVNKLRAMRGPGEDYSAVILRLAKVKR